MRFSLDLQNVSDIILPMVAMKSEKIGKLLILQSHDKRGRLIKTVFCKYVPVALFDADNIDERKLAAIELVERGLCNQKTAGKICGFHRNTVFKLLRTKRLLGLEEVFKDNRGLKQPYKYVGKIRSHIKRLLRKYPDWIDQAVADQAAKDLNMPISRNAVARIRTEKQEKKIEEIVPSKAELMELAKVATAIDEERFDARQLRFCFEKDPELKQKSEEFEKEPAPRPQKATDKHLVKRLQEGERCNFCGGLMHHLFMQEIGFEELLAPFPLNRGSTYQSGEILATLFQSVNLGIPSIEALKLVNASELGVLIGIDRSPDKETLRSHLGRMAQHNLSGNLIDRFAERLLQRGQIDPEVFFIDGHFLPYYGLNVIAKGYYTVRRLAVQPQDPIPIKRPFIPI